MHVVDRSPKNRDVLDERNRPAAAAVGFDRLVEAAISRRGAWAASWPSARARRRCAA